MRFLLTSLLGIALVAALCAAISDVVFGGDAKSGVSVGILLGTVGVMIGSAVYFVLNRIMKNNIHLSCLGPIIAAGISVGVYGLILYTFGGEHSLDNDTAMLINGFVVTSPVVGLTGFVFGTGPGQTRKKHSELD